MYTQRIFSQRPSFSCFVFLSKFSYLQMLMASVSRTYLRCLSFSSSLCKISQFSFCIFIVLHGLSSDVLITCSMNRHFPSCFHQFLLRSHLGVKYLLLMGGFPFSSNQPVQSQYKTLCWDVTLESMDKHSSLFDQHCPRISPLPFLCFATNITLQLQQLSFCRFILFC